MTLRSTALVLALLVGACTTYVPPTPEQAVAEGLTLAIAGAHLAEEAPDCAPGTKPSLKNICLLPGVRSAIEKALPRATAAQTALLDAVAKHLDTRSAILEALAAAANLTASH